jgi:hypothetical protein
MIPVFKATWLDDLATNAETKPSSSQVEKAKKFLIALIHMISFAGIDFFKNRGLVPSLVLIILS